MTMFIMSSETACEVYDAFIMAEALSEEERVKVLLPFVKSGKVQAINTDMNAEEITKALSTHFKILNVKRKQNG